MPRSSNTWVLSGWLFLTSEGYKVLFRASVHPCSMNIIWLSSWFHWGCSKICLCLEEWNCSEVASSPTCGGKGILTPLRRCSFEICQQQTGFFWSCQSSLVEFPFGNCLCSSQPRNYSSGYVCMRETSRTEVCIREARSQEESIGSLVPGSLEEQVSCLFPGSLPLTEQRIEMERLRNASNRFVTSKSGCQRDSNNCFLQLVILFQSSCFGLYIVPTLLP